ncbi:probable hexokinase-like 2 protein [Ipomoea triloba]|uniref:probable hexokinase-like 2 protein n=1 Tax=Ipomoea triloba TaxID=35885 RepID=UPI00125D3B9F|nr:probable hexokinase-like 2 protein [Ipomoea triloba]
MEMRKEVVVLAALTTVSTVVAATLLVRSWKRRSERRWIHAHRILRKFARDCATPVHKLRNIADDIVSDMRDALSSSQKCSSLQMLPCDVASLPTGEEPGLHYGINLRGDNFLVLRARLGGKREPVTELSKQEIVIPPEVIKGTYKDLFDLIALELSEFISMHGDSTKDMQGQRKLGFTISQPLPVVEATASMDAAIINLKGSTIEDTEKDVYVNEINNCLEKHGVDLRVLGLVDDTVGVLAGGRYYSRESVAAVTLGMGTNVVYVDSAQAVEKWPGKLPQSSELVIDMQWGNFYSSHLPITEFDVSLDTESTNPGYRRFEKLISGVYLGEIVRRVLLKIAQETGLYGDSVPPKLATPYVLRSRDMAEMHQDMSEDYEVINAKLKEIFEIADSTQMSREIVANICDIVAQRAARLIGAGIIAIINKLERLTNRISIITVDGGIYDNYRVFRSYLNSSVWEMLGNELSDNVILEHSHGGSGAGSIFLAALHSQPSD